MLLNQIQNFNNSTHPNFGSKKIPRYLYHLTTAKNYQSMLNDKELKTSNDAIKGVYMLDLKNFFKSWCNIPIIRWGDRENLASDILRHVVYDRCDRGVLLRVPTKLLDRQKLLIRSQTLSIAMHDEYEFRRVYNQWDLKGDLPEGRFRYYFTGESAVKAHKSKKQAEAIEYIYPKNIHISGVEKVGEVEIADYPEPSLFKEIFAKLLHGKPEKKATVLLNNEVSQIN